jgi:CheY-like chemotaxis protein
MQAQTKPLEIVYTDDDDDDLGFFREALAEIDKPTRLETFTGSNDLFTYLYAPEPPVMDILFLDINMPGKNGLDCLYEIRQSTRYSKIPVIMFTTSMRPLDIEASYLKGANMYMKKPAGFRELVATLQKLFSDRWYGRIMNYQKPKYIPHKADLIELSKNRYPNPPGY